MLECQDGSIYTGIAVDVAARYQAHVNGVGAQYTRAHLPKKLLLVLEYENRSAASKAEYAVKQLSANAKRLYIAKTLLNAD